MSAGLRREVSRYSLALHERGWVANHDGNVSARSGGGFLITPTAVSKRLCGPESIVECDAAGVSRGRGRPPSEVALHVGAYRRRAEVGAVIHAHPPHASAFALARVALSPVTMPEVVVSLGPAIPLVPLLLPKDPRTEEVAASAVERADACLLAGNGVLTVGVDLEQAYLRMELVEHYAQLVSIAKCIGGAAPLDATSMAALLALRKKAGLGAPREGEGEAPAATKGIAELIRPLVAEELARALGGKS